MAPVKFLKCETLLICGQIATGKSAVAKSVATLSGANLIQVRNILREVLQLQELDRKELQTEGTALDLRTEGRWLAHFLGEKCPIEYKWIIDSVRTRKQVQPILQMRPNTRLIYLDATEETRRERFLLSAGTDPIKRSTSFNEAMWHEIEVEARKLYDLADLVIETDNSTIWEISKIVLESVGWEKIDSTSLGE